MFVAPTILTELTVFDHYQMINNNDQYNSTRVPQKKKKNICALIKNTFGYCRLRVKLVIMAKAITNIHSIE